MSERDSRVFVQTAAPGQPAQAVDAVEALFAALPAAARLNESTRVVLKPNLMAGRPPEKAVTTHPHVVRAVILALQKRGVRHITVADSPGGPYTPAVMQSVYAASGLAAVCEETGAVLYTACESVQRPAPERPGRMARQFPLLRPVAECDFLINLPKLKTHVLTGFTGAVKNLFGCVPGLQKAELHMQFPQKPHFCRMLVDVCETVQADLHIVDGIIAMEGDGPGSGNPRQAGLLLAGENPYQVDLALCRYLGVPPLDMPIVAAAHEGGLCPAALDEALLVGSAGAKAPFAGFAVPSSFEGLLNFSLRVPAPLRPLMPALTRWASPKPAVRKRACIGCGKCAEICPQQVITLPGGKARIRRKECIRCFCCHEVCPVKAIAVRRNRLFKM